MRFSRSDFESISTRVEGNEFGAKMINLGASVAIGAAAGAFTGGAGAAAIMSAGSLSSQLQRQSGRTDITAAQLKAQIMAKRGGTTGAAVRGAGIGALETGITGGIRDTASSLT